MTTWEWQVIKAMIRLLLFIAKSNQMHELIWNQEKDARDEAYIDIALLEEALERDEK